MTLEADLARRTRALLAGLKTDLYIGGHRRGARD